jgi:hypothetical protein
MKFNDRELVIVSGATASTSYMMLPGEYATGFYCDPTLSGTLTLQECFGDYTGASAKNVYNDQKEVVQWTNTFSGALLSLESQALVNHARFTVSPAPTSAKTIKLRVVEL